MARKDHVRVVKGGGDRIKEWRDENPNDTLDLRRADLSRQDLTQADLRNANLEWADLRWCDAVGAKFDGANLIRADFHKTGLTGASFSNADLTETNFEDAKLTEVSFDGATISGTRFLNNDLSGVKGLESCVFGKASLLDRETLVKSKDLPLEFLHACGMHVPYQATVCRVVVASPGDVAPQRDVIRDAIYSWNDNNSEEYRTVLLPVLWETHSTPEMGDHPQSILNHQIIDPSHILIGIFWSRLGTPTPEAVSGTVSEIQRFQDAGKRVLLYFSKAPLPHDVDTEQLGRLREFKEAIQKWGLFDQFESDEELVKKVQRHLTNVVKDADKQSESNVPPPISEPTSPRTNASTTEEKTILLAALENEGRFLFFQPHHENPSGFLHFGDKCLGEGDLEAAASFFDALESLQTDGFVRRIGKDGRTLTGKGFQAARELELNEKETP